jgi:hypothetical protein
LIHTDFGLRQWRPSSKPAVGRLRLLPAQFAPSLDALIHLLASPYYVGLLKAAEVHDPTSQAVIERDMDAEGE